MVGSADTLDRLYIHAREQGLSVQKMDIRGKVHNPENQELAAELCVFCDRMPGFQLSEASCLRVPVRSNISGQLLMGGSLTNEVVTTILASKCNWFHLVNNVAKDLELTGRAVHEIISFGMNDCVPMSPFLKRHLRTKKLEAHGLIRKLAPSVNQNHDRDRQHRCDGSDTSTSPENAIAVIGASLRLPGANDLEELWQLISKGADRHQELPADRFTLHGSYRASQSGDFTRKRKFFGNFIQDVKSFDNSFFNVSAREAVNMDPQQRILLELSHEVLETSGYLSCHRRELGDAVGCFIGASLVEYLDNTNAHGPTAYTSTGTIRAFLCGKLSHYYGWSGPSEVIDTACSSSLVAINRACKAILTGECVMALAGGVNVITGMNNYLDLSKAGFLSPTGQCKPFDESADGYCRSDGAGLVFLKKLKQALNDRDDILGVIPGIATNQGGLSASITIPDSTAQKVLYRDVLQQAGIRPEQVSYIESHGTGTQAGDPVEMESIRSIFGGPSRSEQLHVGSIKGNVGHCETAAGVAGLLKVLAMIRHSKIPPQANHNQLNSKISPLENDGIDIARRLMIWVAPLRVALVNSYGAAGSNCALICRQPTDREKTIETSRYRNKTTKLYFSVTLSAVSDEILLTYKRAMAAYLRSQGARLDIGDVTYTLNHRRRPHRFCTAAIVKNTEELIEHLESFESPSFQYVEVSRPVVLVFSGQNSRTVALDKNTYNNYPAFRSYVDACDLELKQLGYKSILPFIFQASPIDGIVSLQCCIFAVQYACARCWMDAGLKVDTVIGHSLGELTALAVCGVLSLRDCVHLVAFRASLIDTEWGADQGAMLAIHADSAEREGNLSDLELKLKDVNLEIACYNGPNTLIAAGSSAIVDAAEELLKTTLQKVRIQRLDISHGFHSSLIEPILPALDCMSKTLQWNEPQIPIEVCRENPLDSIRGYEVTRHAREPVFFTHAVRRVESLLGSCIWVEAGIDTPIISMTKRALQNPDIHTLQAMKTTSPRLPTESVDNLISGLWPNGIFLEHWSMLPSPTHRWRQTWLPPHPFKKASHWLENVDRPRQIKDELLKETYGVSQNEEPDAVKLVERRESHATSQALVEFRVNTQCRRFQRLVEGHAVRSQALCPASMYMECVTMALQILSKDLESATLCFGDVMFQAALGLDPQREVILYLELLDGESSWSFSIGSSVSTGSRQRRLTHASGTITLVSNPKFEVFQRLVEDHIDTLKSKDETEKLMSKRAYGLFAQVVNYEQFFRGISSILLTDREAVATINMPEHQPNREDSTAWRSCDAVLVDAYIQVVGLLINSSNAVSKGEIMVATGIDHAMISPDCKSNLQSPWEVFARFAIVSKSQSIGDVFVRSPGKSIVAILSGCRFTKLPIANLEKSLRSANPSSTVELPISSDDINSSTSSLVAGKLFTPDTVSQSSHAPSDFETAAALDLGESKIRKLIASYIGLNESDIPQDVNLGEIGLDSLAAVELVEELSSSLGLQLSSDEIPSITVNAILQRIGATRNGNEAVTVHNANCASLAEPRSSERRHSYAQDPQPCSRESLVNILVSCCGAEPSDVEGQHALVDLGIDSLSLIDLKQALEGSFEIQFEGNQPNLESTVEELASLLQINSSKRPKLSLNGTAELSKDPPVIPEADMADDREILSNPFPALVRSNAEFDISANKQGFSNYWSDVAPFQGELLLAYIVEAFRNLGIDLSTIASGSLVPPVPHLPKHKKVVSRLWSILESHGIVVTQSHGIVRGDGNLKEKTSSDLYENLNAQCPRFEHETELMRLTGPKLADCLSGEVDPVHLMFGSPASLKIMENFYSKSPMMSTMTEQLVTFLMKLLQSIDFSRRGPVRILEVGAGTGGTSTRLAEALEAAYIAVRYTFTDVSPSLVSKAKSKLGKYTWMDFATLNLEKDLSEAFRNRFDIVISANCVHATTSRTMSCRRLRETLVRGGFVVLSEVTEIIDWYDICFGLLDGWWLAEGGTVYPLQSAQAWTSSLQQAGFVSVGFSSGPIPEANSQQLLVGCIERHPVPLWLTEETSPSKEGTFQLETMVYKEVDGIQIHADVYIPRSTRTSLLPIGKRLHKAFCSIVYFSANEASHTALMIHGGGHVTLSRKAVRPAQTRYLLLHDFLPVSVDYRLCPEVDLASGPIADVHDAYCWAQKILPEIMRGRGFVVDGDKVVVIGWSTGGHLAMSIGWTTRQAGIPPPKAVLSFYAPTDFESGGA